MKLALQTTSRLSYPAHLEQKKKKSMINFNSIAVRGRAESVEELTGPDNLRSPDSQAESLFAHPSVPDIYIYPSIHSRLSIHHAPMH